MNTIGTEEPLWVGSAIFEQGDSGPAVRQLQKAMNRAGFSVNVDGQFDWRMERKVRAFQDARDIPETGTIGPAMKNVLRRAQRQKERKEQERIEKQQEIKFRKQLAGGSALAAIAVAGSFLYLNQRS